LTLAYAMNSATVVTGTPGVYFQHERRTHDARDRSDISDDVEIELVVERCTDGMRRADQKEGIAICGRIHDRLGTYIAAAARSVLDHELLAETLRQTLTYKWSHDIMPAASGKGDDEAHRPHRIGLCPRKARYGGESDGARCPMEKLSARKFHRVAPASSRKTRAKQKLRMRQMTADRALPARSPWKSPRPAGGRLKTNRFFVCPEEAPMTAFAPPPPLAPMESGR